VRAHARTLLAVALLVLAADVLTKILAVARLTPGVPAHAIGPVRWTLQRNPGAAFSLFTKVPVLFTIFAAAIVVVILARLSHVRDRVTAVALGLVLGGALGNLGDRVFRAPGPLRGHVVDFVDLRVWPVFNVADACIVSGALLLLIASSRRPARDGGAESHA
jgi:signal peptidase II